MKKPHVACRKKGLSPPLIFFALAFLLVATVGHYTHNSGFYPVVVVQTADKFELFFLQNKLSSTKQCAASAETIASLMMENCSKCKVLVQQCTTALPPESRSLLSEVPLQVPSARTPHGVIAYAHPDAKEALAACEQSQKQAEMRGQQNQIVCYPAGNPRPFEDKQKQVVNAVRTIYNLLASTALLLLSVLLATVINGYFQFGRANLYSNSTRHGEKVPYKIWPAKLALAITDTLVLLCTFIVLAWPDIDIASQLSYSDRNVVIAYLPLLLITIAWFWLLLEHYARRRPFWDELREIFSVLLIMFFVASTIVLLAGLDTARNTHLLVWLFNFILLPLGRMATKDILDCFGLWRQPAVMIGIGENARQAFLAVHSEENMGYEIIAFIAPFREEEAQARHPSAKINDFIIPIIQAELNVNLQLRKLGNPKVILALESLNSQSSQDLAQSLASFNGNIHVIPSIRGLPLFGTQIAHFFSHEVIFLTIRNNLARRSAQVTKRIFDVVVASLLIVALSPLMVFVAWKIWREDGSPIIFRQPRLAKDKGEFPFLKFRSMARNADEILEKWREVDSPFWQEYAKNNFKLKNDPRVLKIGHWIRSTSIDELPQLLNVLRGEMSLVGPRPLLPREMNDYGRTILFYRQSRPGITGLWQVSGRSHTKFSDRARLDEWYIKNWSVWYDLVILFKTVRVLVERDGAY